MSRSLSCRFARALFLVLTFCTGLGECRADEPSTPEARAVAYLAREVPGWVPEHNCRSCHNNGDAARALLVARKRGLLPDAGVLDNTLDWIAQPDEWKNNGGDQEFSDQQLAALQFSAALAESASEPPTPAQQEALVAAGRLIVPWQQEDGSWRTIAPGSVGSPVTWGRFLATALARRTLALAGDEAFTPAIARADAWLGREAPRSVLDAGSLLLGLAGRTDDDAGRQRRLALEIIRPGEAEEGGWGPFVTSAPEAFDTAIVLSGLAAAPRTDEIETLIKRGRHALIEQQLSDGSWIETTRPAGNVSYSQRISTSAWGTLALFATKDVPRKPEGSAARKKTPNQ